MALEDDCYYTDKYSDKEVRLKQEEGLVTVTFGTGATEDLEQGLVDRGWTPYFIAKGPVLSSAVVAGAIAAEFSSEALASPQSVRDWIPVYRDQEGGRHYILPGHLDVQFVEGTDPARAQTLIDSMGGSIVGNVRTPGYYSVSVPSSQRFFATVRAFSLLPEVEFAVPSLLGDRIPVKPIEKIICSSGLNLSGNSRKHAVAEPLSEPFFCNLWAFKNMQIIGAWEVTFGSSDVILAVVDSGMDLQHPDLSPNLFPRESESWNFVPGGGPEPMDDEDDGHGTGLCGVVAAALNGEGIVGVAPRCSLMPLKVVLNGQLKTRAEAIYYVAERAARDRRHRYVINLSWVMPCDYPGVRRAVTKAICAGALVVAGVDQSRLSEGRDMDLGPPTYPASYPNVLAVTATDENDRKGVIVDFGRRVDLCAPGANICTTGLGGTYCFFQGGTSFAAAQVSGLAALIWSLDKEKLTYDVVSQLLKQSCDPIDDKNPDLEGKLGAGRINAFAAVQQTLRWLGLGKNRQRKVAI